jgi:hypothetical protein
MKESLLYQPQAEPTRKALSNLERAYYEVSKKRHKEAILEAINLIREDKYEQRHQV